MRFRTFLVALVVGALAVSVASAQPPPGVGKRGDAAAAKERVKAAKGKAKAALKCRGGVIQLRGELAGAPSGSSFALSVKQANKHGRALKGKQVTVLTNERTRVRRQGPAEVSDLQAGDRAKVLVRRCRDAEGDQELLAKLVVARPAKAEEGDDDSSTSTSTSTETTTETTDSTSTSTSTETTTTTTP